MPAIVSGPARRIPQPAGSSQTLVKLMTARSRSRNPVRRCSMAFPKHCGA